MRASVQVGLCGFLVALRCRLFWLPCAAACGYFPCGPARLLVLVALCGGWCFLVGSCIVEIPRPRLVVRGITYTVALEITHGGPTHPPGSFA